MNPDSHSHNRFYSGPPPLSIYDEILSDFGSSAFTYSAPSAAGSWSPEHGLDYIMTEALSDSSRFALPSDALFEAQAPAAPAGSTESVSMGTEDRYGIQDPGTYSGMADATTQLRVASYVLGGSVDGSGRLTESLSSVFNNNNSIIQGYRAFGCTLFWEQGTIPFPGPITVTCPHPSIPTRTFYPVDDPQAMQILRRFQESNIETLYINVHEGSLVMIFAEDYLSPHPYRAFEDLAVDPALLATTVCASSNTPTPVAAHTSTTDDVSLAVASPPSPVVAPAKTEITASPQPIARRKHSHVTRKPLRAPSPSPLMLRIKIEAIKAYQQAQKKLGQGNVLCTVAGCNWSFTRKQDLRRHLNSSRHRRDNPNQVPCEVPGCGKMFSRADAVQRHNRESKEEGHQGLRRGRDTASVPH